MIDNYFKQLEKLIVPKTYSIQELQKLHKSKNHTNHTHTSTTTFYNQKGERDSVISNISTGNISTTQRTKLLDKEIKENISKNNSIVVKNNNEDNTSTYRDSEKTDKKNVSSFQSPPSSSKFKFSEFT